MLLPVLPAGAATAVVATSRVVQTLGDALWALVAGVALRGSMRRAAPARSTSRPTPAAPTRLPGRPPAPPQSAARARPPARPVPPPGGPRRRTGRLRRPVPPPARPGPARGRLTRPVRPMGYRASPSRPLRRVLTRAGPCAGARRRRRHVLARVTTWTRSSTRSRRRPPAPAGRGARRQRIDRRRARSGRPSGRASALLRTGSNLGYGRAANLGVPQAPGDWVVIANPDLTWEPGALDTLLEAVERWPSAGVLGPAILSADGTLYPSARQLPSLGRGIGHALCGWWWPSNPWTAAYRRERGAPTERLAGWLSGSCMLRAAGGVRRGRRLRPGVLHVLRGSRPVRADRPGRLAERVRADRGGRPRGRRVDLEGPADDGRRAPRQRLALPVPPVRRAALAAGPGGAAGRAGRPGRAGPPGAGGRRRRQARAGRRPEPTR